MAQCAGQGVDAGGGAALEAAWRAGAGQMPHHEACQRSFTISPPLVDNNEETSAGGRRGQP